MSRDLAREMADFRDAVTWDSLGLAPGPYVPDPALTQVDLQASAAQALIEQAAWDAVREHMRERGHIRPGDMQGLMDDVCRTVVSVWEASWVQTFPMPPDAPGPRP